MIKTTPKQILEGMAGLDALLKGTLPIKAKYAVSKLTRACQSELEDFNKARDQLFKDAGCTQGEKDGVKQWVHAEPEKLEAAKKQVEELLAAEVEINALPLDIETFGDGDISGPAFLGLDWAMKPDAPASGAPA